MRTYRHPWTLFKEFERTQFNNHQLSLPIQSDILVLFTAHLYELNYSPSTVLTYLSAIGYVHRLANLPDPSKSEQVKLMLRGYSNLKPADTDSRLPITLPLLERTLQALDVTQSSHFQQKLAKAMCSLAFFATLRVGEITIRPGQALRNVIHFYQISFMKDHHDTLTAIKLSLVKYKHSDPS